MCQAFNLCNMSVYNISSAFILIWNVLENLITKSIPNMQNRKLRIYSFQWKHHRWLRTLITKTFRRFKFRRKVDFFDIKMSEIFRYPTFLSLVSTFSSIRLKFMCPKSRVNILAKSAPPPGGINSTWEKKQGRNSGKAKK